MENSFEWIASLYGIWISNKVAVLIDPLTIKEDMEYLLNHSDTTTIFCNNNSYKNVKAVSGENVSIINVDNQVAPQSLNYSSKIDVPVEQDALIIYTSGTSGKPKGVVLNFKSLISVTQDFLASGHVEKEYRMFQLLPFFHIFPFISTLFMPFYKGMTGVMCNSFVSLDIVQALKKGKVNVIMSVPKLYEGFHKTISKKLEESKIGTFFYSIQKKIKSRTFARIVFKKIHNTFGGNLKLLVCGGAPIDDNIFEDFNLWGFTFFMGYGMSESAGLISIPYGEIKCGTVGNSILSMGAKIDDGEILIKGPNVMKGYYKNKQETEKTFKDGWLKTGDLGQIDEDGYITITGRKKELLIFSNGKNISPVEIESSLKNHLNNVIDYAVYMEKDHLSLAIYPNYDLIGKNSCQKYFEQAVESYNEKVQSFKKIASLNIVKEELPKTRIGKIKRFTLAELLKNNWKRRKSNLINRLLYNIKS
jgi:long-chain acyl-CoA synthetase